MNARARQRGQQQESRQPKTPLKADNNNKQQLSRVKSHNEPTQPTQPHPLIHTHAHSRTPPPRPLATVSHSNHPPHYVLLRLGHVRCSSFHTPRVCGCAHWACVCISHVFPDIHSASWYGDSDGDLVVGWPVAQFA